MSGADIHLCYYAVAFIDLLGQRAAMPGRHLPENEEDAVALVRESVGRIIGTQKSFQKFYDAYTSSDDGIYSYFPPEMQNQVPDMAPGELRWQRFSDGFVIFVPLGKGLVKSPVNSIFGLLMASGLHCMVGLAAKGPVRVGIDVAWGVEYRPNEIYGAALAYSYHLESKVAQWPRVVVGEGLTDFLLHYNNAADNDLSSQFRREMAQLCLSLITTDTDGNQILHYLGPEFRKASQNTFNERIVSDARAFIDSQINHWHAEKNNILVDRYVQVADYIARYGRDL